MIDSIADVKAPYIIATNAAVGAASFMDSIEQPLRIIMLLATIAWTLTAIWFKWKRQR